MEIYKRITAHFSSLSTVSLWEEMRTLFRYTAAGRPDHWRIPLLACEAVGGDREMAIPAMTAVACAHIGIILVDDMLDSDPRGEYQKIGPAAAANLAVAFQSAALETLTRADIPPNAQVAVLKEMNAMFLTTALGQFWDIQSPGTEETYWKVVQTKSSPFFGTALYLGGLMGGTAIETANKLRELGRLYGEMIQIHDDLNDSLAIPANPDWIQNRSPLPILFAKLVDHPDRGRFAALCQNIHVPGALEEAQEILIRCGAVSYCVDQLVRRSQSIHVMLTALPLKQPEPLNELFGRVIAPVWNLFEMMGGKLEISNLNEPATPG